MPRRGVGGKTGAWSASARRVLEERYLWRDEAGELIEDADGMCWRVARAIAAAEVKWGHDPEPVAEQFADILLDRKFMPNSPTLMNAGKNNGLQLSACFVLPVDDSMEGIFESVKHAAIIHKSGGGTGFAFSRLRPEGATVSSTHGAASGPVSFMRVFNEATEAVKQGGTRRGANMGILRVDHPDVLKFIDCKRTGGITNFNISVAITEKFVRALAGDTDYELVDPHNGEVTGTLRAKTVFDKIAEAAWATGDPGLIFIDRINSSPANPTPEVGLIEATNPCGEQPLLGYEACNLGSINLAQFVVERGGRREVDWAELDRVCRISIRFLDDVIEVNPYPLPQIHDMVKANRRVGLGVMGWADLLFMLGIPYDSEEALQLADRVMSRINRAAHAATEELAVERGPFPNWVRSIYRDGKPMRNSTVTTIAPTGTISIISDCSSGVEPIFALAFVHKSGDRLLRFVNPIFEETAKKRGFYSDQVMQDVLFHGTVHGVAGVPQEAQRVFVTAHEIAPDWHVRMQAAFQRHTDNAVSKTINLPNSATVDDVRHAYLLAHELGCMGITIFRDGCKGEQVLNAGVGGGEKKAEAPAAPPVPVLDAKVKERPAVVFGYTTQIHAPEGKVNVTLNSDDTGLLEVFINIGKAGSDLAALAEAMGRLISLNLRLPSPMSQEDRVREIIDQLGGIGGSRTIGFGQMQLRSLPDALAKVLERHITEHPSPERLKLQEEQPPLPGLLHTGNLCPKCGCSTLVFEEGCKKCYACGHSEC